MKRILLVLFVLVVCSSAALEVFACTCIPPRTPTEEREASIFVFAGEVIRIDTVIIQSYPMRNVRFRVQRIWKGGDSTQVDVLTGMSDADCGYHFGIGKAYLVYAFDFGLEDQPVFSTNICRRTNLLAWATEDLEELGEGTPVAVEEEAPPRPFSLAQNYPNPFHPTTHIAYALERPGFVQLTVYDLYGRRLQTLVRSFRRVGVHAVAFDAGSLPAGVHSQPGLALDATTRCVRPGGGAAALDAS